MPTTIPCVDCGEPAYLTSRPPDGGWEEGDIATYRCRGCHDRWDIQVGDSSHPRSSDFDFAAWLAERNRD